MEEWRDIPGYVGIYEASTFGRIRSKEGKMTYSAKHGARCWKQRILKQKVCRNKKGRIEARVDLWKDGAHKTFLVSRLVAMTWIPGYSPELTVNHRDGSPLNNKADNLEWVPLADNIKRSFSDGLHSNCKQIRLQSGNRIYHHDSMAEASRSLGRNKGYIHNCLRKSRPILSTCGVEYKIV